MGPAAVRMNHPFESNKKDLAQRWSQWQPDAPLHNDETQANGQPELRKAGYLFFFFSFSAFDPSAKPFSLGVALRHKAIKE